MKHFLVNHTHLPQAAQKRHSSFQREDKKVVILLNIKPS